jgi:CheY-like chemotaxis protein
MPKTVLIVEDYADTRHMMKFLLQDFGFEVFEAETVRKPSRTSDSLCPI